jgi:YidC/Oxa1 family membrane protein insertase
LGLVHHHRHRLDQAVFYPLSQASGRSMAKMRAVGPRMKQIQETFKDDREKLGRAMMELYKKEKINPLAGCLPMLVQVPVFISFYRVLLESVEMRQAPFLLWINDLSSRILFSCCRCSWARAMFAQFKLNPAPPDPDAGEGHAVHAAGHDRHDGVVPVWAGALLADQHRAVHRPAVAGEPSGQCRGQQAAIVGGMSVTPPDTIAAIATAPADEARSASFVCRARGPGSRGNPAG